MRSEALITAQKRYYEKIKNTDKFKLKVKQYNEKQKEKYKNNSEFREMKKIYQKNYYKNKKNK